MLKSSSSSQSLHPSGTLLQSMPMKTRTTSRCSRLKTMHYFKKRVCWKSSLFKLLEDLTVTAEMPRSYVATGLAVRVLPRFAGELLATGPAVSVTYLSTWVLVQRVTASFATKMLLVTTPLLTRRWTELNTSPLMKLSRWPLLRRPS